MTIPQWAMEKIQEVKEKNLTTLSLDRRFNKTLDPLIEIPNTVFDLPQLTELNLNSNQLSVLPESITKLRNLTSLNLGNNKFSTIPGSIAKLQNLTKLYLEFNQFTVLPKTIFELQNLTFLDLQYNELGSLPAAITKLHNLTSLILDGIELISLPESITNLQNLTSLSLYNTKITDLPKSITKLQKLTELYLGYNQLNTLPEVITELQNLKMLEFNQNQLTRLPEFITKLQKLECLQLSENQLTSLPEFITELHNLKLLFLDGNQFTSLPEIVTNLNNLVGLSLDDANLNSLPESIAKLQNLEALFLVNNQLTSLPESIIKLQNLKNLNITGNQLSNPPQEVAEKGIEAIREYFRQLSEGQDYLHEAKLLILGEGGAGKTTLAKKIENPNYILKEEISTEGVDVKTWLFSIDSGKPFRVNIWDFGGQEIYHATHQFFLTKRSLYVLVTDTRKEDTDFYYWLNAVELFSDNSPILIIKNEKQDRHRDLNERQLRGQFENLKEVLATNLDTNRGLDMVKSEIEHYIKNLPHIGSPLPKTWVSVRESLEHDSRNYISLNEYLSICKGNGFTETKNSMQLSDYLNDIGVFLHFQDDPLLRKTVILKPKWGTDAVYKVLDNTTVIKNLGRFTRTDLDMIWDAPEYENMREELLQLMMKFRLCYEIPAQKGAYIAPQLLTENQPEYEWDVEDNLLLRYTYEFMPKGILLQFIVMMSGVIWEHNVWKSGVVLKNNKTSAEVVEYYGKRELHVRIAGLHKKEMMTIVMHELDKIHATYKRLKYDKLIPCNCVECKTKKEPYFYRFEILQKFIEDRQEQIQCQQSYKMVNVRSLIDDVLKKDYLREEREAPMAQYIIHGDYIDQGDKKMTDNKISISNSTIHGSVVAAESIKDSFNVIDKADIKEDLKEQLKQLNQAVEAMAKELPKEKAEEVADDMKRLAEEATKKAPNKKWYSVSIEGLIAAAENLDKLGEPVINLSKKVLSLLTAGLIK